MEPLPNESGLINFDQVGRACSHWQIAQLSLRAARDAGPRIAKTATICPWLSHDHAKLSMAVLRVGARNGKFCSWADCETQRGLQVRRTCRVHFNIRQKVTKAYIYNIQAGRHDTLRVSSPFIHLKATLCVLQEVPRKGSTEAGAWPLALGWKRVDAAQLAQSPGCLGSYAFLGLRKAAN